jgi:2-polyprenyl-6-hydroxyphenyl methylase/3-demethylubiquinone-9 3-methyltransferase
MKTNIKDKKWSEAITKLKKTKYWPQLKPYLKDFIYTTPTVKDVWKLLDTVWDDFNLNNKKYKKKGLDDFYSHPIWLVNGFFTEIDPESQKHRESIANFLKNMKEPKILDYGGGFGALAKKIAEQNHSSQIYIYDPNASNFVFENIKDFKNIEVISKIKEEEFDVIINQDLLEHVEDPIQLTTEFNHYLKKEGILISHWNFSSCIKCHLPKHFHFKYTFKKIIPFLGFSKEIKNNNHGHYYKKINYTTKINVIKAKILEKISKTIHPLLLNIVLPVYKKIKQYL